MTAIPATDSQAPQGILIREEAYSHATEWYSTLDKAKGVVILSLKGQYEAKPQDPDFPLYQSTEYLTLPLKELKEFNHYEQTLLNVDQRIAAFKQQQSNPQLLRTIFLILSFVALVALLCSPSNAISYGMVGVSATLATVGLIFWYKNRVIAQKVAPLESLQKELALYFKATIQGESKRIEMSIALFGRLTECVTKEALTPAQGLHILNILKNASTHQFSPQKVKLVLPQEK